MSMDRCYKCSGLVDTDYDPECYLETKYGDRCYCEPCREAIELEHEVMERKADMCLQQMEETNDSHTSI